MQGHPYSTTAWPLGVIAVYHKAMHAETNILYTLQQKPNSLIHMQQPEPVSVVDVLGLPLGWMHWVGPATFCSGYV